MEEKIFNAALAGLLHDIGKVAQRARHDPWKVPQGLEDTGQPVHAAWSEDFIQTNVPVSYRAAARFGVYHHKPDRSPSEDNSLSKLIALADKLSAGERSDPEDTSKYPPQQMITIFDRLDIAQVEGAPPAFLPLKAVALEENKIFPDTITYTPEERLKNYEQLLELLVAAVRSDPGDKQTYLENILAAMQRVAWCIPSAYYHSVPDVSLYDHSRMTAALAVCLANKENEEVQLLLEAVERNFHNQPEAGDEHLLAQPVALLVGGDISGIQDFIFTISSKGAAKTLRGRSFYLQLLTEAVLRYTLEQFGIPYTNVIYSGGGHFYLLAPLSVAEKLSHIQRYVTRTLLAHHGTALYLALGSCEIPASGFRLGALPQYWNKMHTNLSHAKKHRFAELEKDEFYRLVFEIKEHGGNQEATCSVCGTEQRAVKLLHEDEASSDKICSLCNSFDLQLGKRLPASSHIVLGFGKPVENTAETALDILSAFGMFAVFASSQDKEISFESNCSPDRAVIWALEDSEKWPSIKDLPACRMLHYTVNQVPQMTFDKLQENASGIKRLGVLRMDVDNLGDLFKTGFTTRIGNIASLARFSTLSFQLSLFFDGWVKKICEKKSSLIYAVYSGGDDLFLIGPWHLMPPLAQEIASSFEKYTSNARLHLSGGMSFIHGKYPVYQAAEDAHDALEKAKDVAGKNAFTFLEFPWKWPEFQTVTEYFTKLLDLDQKYQAAHSLLQLLQKLSRMAENESSRTSGKRIWGPWMWRGDYYLTRMVEQAGKNQFDQGLAKEINHILQQLRSTMYANLHQWGAAARWCQLYIRKK